MAFIMVLFFLYTMLSYTGGELVMPLDDAFIHFQYARQLAQGCFFCYNSEDPPSTGATSLLYPFVLAIGYLLGFSDTRLIVFALGLNALLLAVSAILVYRITFSIASGAQEQSSEHKLSSSAVALLAGLFFLLNGPLLWSFSSGMETGLFTTLILATLDSFIQRRFRRLSLCASLMAMTRPEGLILAGLLALALWLREGGRARRILPAILLPILAGLIQPLLNYVLTGSLSANGMKAKSWFYSVPMYPTYVLNSILAYYREIMVGVFGGVGDEWRYYLPPFFFLFFLGGVLLGALKEWRRRTIGPAILVMLWFFIGLASTATLYNALWHYARYQMPFFPLVIVYGSWGLSAVVRWLVTKFTRIISAGVAGNRRAVGLIAYRAVRRYILRQREWVLVAVASPLIAYSLLTVHTFAGRYGMACFTISRQQMAMARWIDDHLPPQARVAVHDVGVLKYFGHRYVYDLVGLVTNGAAEAGRNGPGSVFEAMESHEISLSGRSVLARPDYIAVYTGAFPPAIYFADTDMFAQELYRVEVPDFSKVASAFSEQAVYRVDWRLGDSGSEIVQTNILSQIQGMHLVDTLDVADLRSEKMHSYRWWQTGRPAGFPTEVRQFSYRADPSRVVLDGGRMMSGGEEMVVRSEPGEDMMIVMRAHAMNDVRLRVFVNDMYLGLWAYPAGPGEWIETAYLVPGKHITSGRTKLRFEAVTESPHFRWHAPFYYWFWQGEFRPEPVTPTHPLSAELGGKVRLLGYDVDKTMVKPGQTINLTLYWQAITPTKESYTVFTHLLDSNNEIWGQKDNPPYFGTYPVWVWREGEIVRDPYAIPVSEDAPPGEYIVEVGMYEPLTGRRLLVRREGYPPTDHLVLVPISVVEE
ncbi:MAG: hypothetical protein H5T62_00500 [Anaerolineae bacterium]|nr:hypothetical protein [Anaerolineae bacterium]